jgi:hypothetical protein
MDELVESILDPVRFVRDLGGLHDVLIEDIHIAEDNERVVLSINDLNANFVGFEEYKGRRQCDLNFHGVTDVFIDLNLGEGIFISELKLKSNNSSFCAEFDLNAGGGAITKCVKSIVITFHTMTIRNWSGPQK